MEKICFSESKINLVRRINKLNEQYWMFDGDISSLNNILIVSTSIDFSFEFIFYNGNPSSITIECDNPFFKAFDKLLDFDNSLVIENDCETRKYDSKIIIRRLEEDIVIDTSHLNNNPFNLIMIKNMELKERLNKFIYEINLSFSNNGNKLQFKKAE